MLYSPAENYLPAYFRASFTGDRGQIHSARKKLSSDPITALHFHDCLELGICLKGEGVNYVEGRKYPYAAGDLQVAPAGVPHLSKAREGVETWWCWISLDPAAVMARGGFDTARLPEDLWKRCFAGLFHPWEHPELARRISEMAALPQAPGEKEALFAACLVGQILYELARMGEREEKKIAHPADGSLLPAVEAIRRGYADREAMREANLAALCGMSCSHFRARFRRLTGMNVRTYLSQTRLAAAAYLLTSTKMSVLQIALESGYGQISCFNRAFRSAFGAAPTAFRRRASDRE